MGSSVEVRRVRREAWEVSWAETTVALRAWTARPAALLPWLAIATALTVALLLGVLLVATRSEPGPVTGILIAADPRDPPLDVAFVVARNLLVLALHLLVCLASHLAQRSLPLQGALLPGWRGTVHRRVTIPALVAVYGLTLIALGQQTLTLGAALADTAAARGEPAALVLLRLLPHAAPELVALFLPLAAAVWLGVRRRPHELLAATLLCLVVALPVVVLAAVLEVVVADRFFR